MSAMRAFPAWRIAAFALLIMISISGCDAKSEGDSPPSGRVTVWHTWSPEHHMTLAEALAGFSDIHPDVTVTVADYPPDDLLAAFERAASAGIAPSLLIGSDAWVRVLADAGWTRSLQIDEDAVTHFLGGAEAATR